MLAGGVLGAAANFGATFGIQCSPSWKSARSPPAYSKTVIASSVIRLTDDTDVPTLSSTYTPWIELRFTSPKLFGESCVVCRLFEDLESRSSGFQSSPQDLEWDSVAQLVLSIAKKSLRNSRTHSWPSDVLNSCDSRFVQFSHNKASNYALSLLSRRTSHNNSSSLRRSRSIPGPAADWATRDSSNISRYCRVSWTNPARCRCSPAKCCVTSSECSAWRLQFCSWVVHLLILASILLMSLPLPVFSLIFKSLICFLRRSR